MLSIRGDDGQHSQHLYLGEMAIADDKATLVPLVLHRESAEGALEVQLSAAGAPSLEIDCDVQFQLENENLRVRHLGGSGGSFNELFNRTGFVNRVTFDAGVLEREVVVVLIPRLTSTMAERLLLMANANAFPETSMESTAPTNLRDFAGTLCFSYIQVSPGLAPSPVVQNIPITGRYCCTLMSTDLTELSFEDCEPNQTYVREFSVWNR